MNHYCVRTKEKSGFVFQAWIDALEEHSAYSTHYCSQEQGSEEEEEEVMSLGELTDTLQVAVNNKIHNYHIRMILSVLAALESPPGPPSLRYFGSSAVSSHLSETRQRRPARRNWRRRWKISSPC